MMSQNLTLSQYYGNNQNNEYPLEVDTALLEAFSSPQYNSNNDTNCYNFNFDEQQILRGFLAASARRRSTMNTNMNTSILGSNIIPYDTSDSTYHSNNDLVSPCDYDHVLQLLARNNMSHTSNDAANCLLSNYNTFPSSSLSLSIRRRRSSILSSLSPKMMTSATTFAKSNKKRRRSTLGVSQQDIEQILSLDKNIGNEDLWNNYDCASFDYSIVQEEDENHNVAGTCSTFISPHSATAIINNNNSYSSPTYTIDPLNEKDPFFSISFAEKYQIYLKSLTSLMEKSSKSRKALEEIKRKSFTNGINDNEQAQKLQQQQQQQPTLPYIQIKSKRRKLNKKFHKNMDCVPTESNNRGSMEKNTNQIRVMQRERSSCSNHMRSLSLTLCTPDMIFG